MIHIEAENLDDLWIKVNEKLWSMEDEEFDFIRAGVTVHTFHNQFVAETADIKMRITDLGYTKTKWAMLLKLYFDSQAFSLLVNRLKMYRSESKGKKFVVDVPMSFKPRFNRSGECLLAITIRFSLKWGWECEVFTRASESISRWGVDLVFIHVLLREVGKHLGFTPSDVRVWWSSASMFQSILTAPLFIVMQDEDRFLEEPETEWQRHVHRRYHAAFNTDSRKYTSYKSQQRVVRAYDVLKGVEEARHVLENDELQLPPVDLVLPEDFFKMGGFK